MQKVDCKRYADEIIESVKNIPDKDKALLIVHAGDDPASAAYMRGKIKDCGRCGVPVMQWKAGTEKELVGIIRLANCMTNIGGIIVQLPLPKGWDESVVDLVALEKDVDGFRKNSPFQPCTPEGIVHILHRELGNDLSGKRVLIIGRGKLVGRPLYELLQYQENMEVMQINSHEKYIHAISNGSPAGIMWHCIITATGQPKLLDVCRCNTNLIIDAGITRGDDGKLCGDCYNFEELARMEEIYEGYNPSITTVPGGVGLMTRAMLMKHMGEVQKRK